MMREMDEEIEQMKKMHDDHMKQFEEQRQKVEDQIQKTLERRQSLQPPAEGEGAQTEGGQVAQSGKPGWHMQQFGSWEPQTFGSPFGKRTVVGPVGYHMYWGYSDPHKEGEGEGEGEGEKSEASAAPGSEETKME